MLKQVLQAMTHDDAYTQAELARRLDISASMLEQMIQELARRGYLQPMDGVEEGGCPSAGCGRCKACAQSWPNQDDTPKRWVLTTKGWAAVNHHRT